MIILILHKRYSHTNLNNKYGKDESDRFVRGAG